MGHYKVDGFGDPSEFLEHPDKVFVKGLTMDYKMKAETLLGYLQDLQSNISCLLLGMQIQTEINLKDILRIWRLNNRTQTKTPADALNKM